MNEIQRKTRRGDLIGNGTPIPQSSLALGGCDLEPHESDEDTTAIEEIAARVLANPQTGVRVPVDITGTRDA